MKTPKCLEDILNDLGYLQAIVKEKSSQVINNACSKLIPLLIKLEETRSESFCADLDLLWILPDETYPYIAGRYCGNFFNAIIIKNTDYEEYKHLEPYQCIELTYRPIEGMDCYDQNFIDDGYNGESGVRRPGIQIDQYDYKNFCQLLECLIPFFQNTELYQEYRNLLIEVNVQVEIDRIYSEMKDLDEQLAIYLLKCFEKSIDFDSHKTKHFFLLPYGVSVRYRGRFCNCIIGTKNQNASLGYLKKTYSSVTEDEYINDIYTIQRDSVKTISEQYILVHELELQSHRHNWDEVYNVLHSFVSLYEESINNGSLDYINKFNVKL